MTKTKLQLEAAPASNDPNPAPATIFELHNLTLKQALQLVRSLATVSPSAPQTESPR